MSLYIEKFAFMFFLVILVLLTLLKAYNIMLGGDLLDFMLMILTFCVGWFAYGFMLVLNMSMPTETAIMGLWSIAPALVGLFSALFVIESILMIVHAAQSNIRGRYQGKNKPIYYQQH